MSRSHLETQNGLWGPSPRPTATYSTTAPLRLQPTGLSRGESFGSGQAASPVPPHHPRQVHAGRQASVSPAVKWEQLRQPGRAVKKTSSPRSPSAT